MLYHQKKKMVGRNCLGEAYFKQDFDTALKRKNDTETKRRRGEKAGEEKKRRESW